jgi:hypothetical protein
MIPMNQEVRKLLSFKRVNVCKIARFTLKKKEESREKVYTLICKTVEEKVHWMLELSECLNKASTNSYILREHDAKTS